MTDRHTDYLERLRALIAEHGHAVQGVMPGERSFGFAYTVGLSQAGQRELLMIGLPMNAAQSLLNDIAKRLKDVQELPAEVDRIATVPLRLREVATKSLAEPLGVFTGLCLPMPATVVQVLWPCPGGFWPGEPGYSSLCPQDPTNLEPPVNH